MKVSRALLSGAGAARRKRDPTMLEAPSARKERRRNIRSTIVGEDTMHARAWLPTHGCKMTLEVAVPFENKLRATVSQHTSLLETMLYVAVGALLVAAAIVGVFQAGVGLWHAISAGEMANSGLLALDQLLLVLMLVEILHTVRISI